MSKSSSTASGGIGLGSVIAVVISWTVNHSVIWCIIHAFCSWLYVIYWVIFYSGLVQFHFS